jgi:hypothetical protein
MGRHVVRMGEIMNAYRILADNLEKRPLGRLRKRPEDNIKMYRQIACENGRWIKLAQCPVALFSIEPAGFIPKC